MTLLAIGLKKPRQEDHDRFETIVGYIVPDCHGLQTEAISQNEKYKVSKIKSKQTNSPWLIEHRHTMTW